MTGHNWLDSQSFRLLVVPCRPPGPRAHLTLIQYFNLQPFPISSTVSIFFSPSSQTAFGCHISLVSFHLELFLGL